VWKRDRQTKYGGIQADSASAAEIATPVRAMRLIELICPDSPYKTWLDGFEWHGIRAMIQHACDVRSGRMQTRQSTRQTIDADICRPRNSRDREAL